jgi:integration host factor subunit alpha
MPSTVTRADLTDAVLKKTSTPRKEAADLVDMIIAEICNAMARGEEVKLSSFATFHVREKGERVGRNPKTGEEAVIAPRKIVSFNASSVLKHHLQKAHLARKPKKVNRTNEQA